METSGMADAIALPELCARCQMIDLGQYFFGEASPSSIELGYYQDILRNEDCLLCKLVIQALSFGASRYWEPGIYPREMCHIGTHRGSVAAPAQPRLQVWFESTTETLPDGICGHITTLGEIHLLEVTPHYNDAARSYKSVCRMVGERANLSVVKMWMEDCANHPKCTVPTPGLSILNDTLPLLLIDVKRMKLAECDWGSRYVALSYVWGRAKQYRTLLRNLKDCLEDGSLLQIQAQLPRVINDAIEFVAALGESYLWVDTLCIVQDDVDSRDKYIASMDRVYGQALLTIIALCGHDANTSLPGVVAGSRKPPHSPAQLGPFKLLAGLPSLFDVEQSSTWSTRAWTFQEGVLSKRCLYFWDHQMYWQCASAHCAESVIGEISDGRMARGSFSPLERNTANDSRLQFFIYQSLSKMYSRRVLTFPSDSLKAFCGVISVMEKSFGWEFASALPGHFFDLALLWRSMGGSKRKVEPPTGGSELPSCHLPTWCWTAWTGFVHWDVWRLDSYAGRNISVDSQVADYFVKDKTGFRRLVRGQSCGKRGGADDTASTQLMNLMEGISHDQALPQNTLVFEANSLPANRYTLSEPMPESSWAMTEPASYRFKNAVHGQLWIYNDAGYHCGKIEGIRSWCPEANVSYDFILLSRNDQDKVTQADIDSHRDRLPPEYFSAAEYYEEVFDTGHFEYKRWWALNILLIKWKGDVAERVGVGLMHADAWDSTCQQRKTIVLR